MLVAGATGAVSLNVMLTSLLSSALPEALRLVLVDSKQVELCAYRDVPHLYAPIVTDMRLRARVLDSIAREMEQRYALLARNVAAALRPSMLATRRRACPTSSSCSTSSPTCS